MDSWHHYFEVLWLPGKKYKILLNSHQMTWLWHNYIRQFRDPVTGVLRYSDAPQNVHFHLRSVCVRTRYPNFNYTWLDVPLQMQQSLSPLHFQKLQSEFYWRLWNPYKLFLKLLSRLGFFLFVIFARPFLL